LLALIALAVATTVILKMHGPKYLWITCVPMVWLVVVTFTAAWQKIFSPLPRIGFLAQADVLQKGPITPQVQTLIFNNQLDAFVCGAFMVLVAIVLADSLRLWYGILRGTADRRVRETPFVMSQLREEF
jgi:carbon starvation protein